MEPLRATLAREINKSDLTEAETLVFDGRILSQTGKQTLEPGEFYFRPTAIPIFTQPGFWARILGAKPKETYKIVDTILIACPLCGMPILTGTNLPITNRHPLTVSRPISCPYSYASGKVHSFSIWQNKIIIA